MARNQIIVGLDVGTSRVRTVAASMRLKEDAKLKIIGIGESVSFGMRKGVVVDIEEMTKSIKKSVEQAERMIGNSIDKAYVAVGGSHIKAKNSKGIAAVSRADEEVSDDDVVRAANNASAVSLGPNKEILDVIQREFNLDGQEGIQDPRGMNGVRLEVDTLIIEGQAQHLKNLRKCLTLNKIEPEALVLNILAGASAVLSKKQKELGVLVLDLGAGTTGMAIYEEGKLLDVQILPIGSAHITYDIAIGLQTSPEVAEKIKIAYGNCIPEEVNKKDVIDLSKIDESEEGVVNRKEMSKIIEARIDEIFELVNRELRKIGKERKLPSGVVLIGGGSKIPGIIDAAKNKLKLNVQIGCSQDIDGLIDKVDDPAFATAVGLIKYASENHTSVVSSPKRAIGFFRKILRTFNPY
ncbi:MAG TPA: cell division protein FtsA [Candidatus Portnoybacteria bacterium]|jgi:cell division protein FtsA|nr:cell division protein FtsA [Candidatus Portnoybacteria bacterium]MDD5751967.1 cell division protein FtsA [Candidatus Portnoybacteria bacterium]HNU96649.1 cell division protein FtsA [Candidatus Portnoybacteria bacterium]HOZ16229.1 cell division protein FtsA [Candidatus Portnoybacteria bacterium]HPH51976.1 cell division protein FtsA [Candidatus Portnoybacteria bacterium]